VTIEVDASDFYRLAAELDAAPAKAIRNVRKAVEVTAKNIKDDGRKIARRRSGRVARGYPAKFDYDMLLDTDGEIGAEIGPETGGQGSLGILEDAPNGVQSAPQHALRDATRQNESDLQRGLEKALDDIF
jgi:biotin operon repressor